METLLAIGPADKGRRLTLDEYLGATAEEGFHYELIDGRLYVSPAPNPPENRVEEWISNAVRLYMHAHPDVLNYVSGRARVFIPGRTSVTAPEPDLTAYRDYPVDLPARDVRWQDLRPLIVVEVLSEGDPDKDLVRNVDLYVQVPSIQEYWVLDAREDADQPTLIVYRRRDRSRWRKAQTFAFGATYTTDLLPGFSLTIDPRP